MSIENELKGSTEGPYLQFDKCTKDINCVYRNHTGYCGHETCIIGNDGGELATSTQAFYFQCELCKKVDCAPLHQIKIRICRDCLAKIHASEVLPFTCQWCGSSQGHRSSIMFSQLCDTCIGKMRAAAYCGHCGRDG